MGIYVGSAMCPKLFVAPRRVPGSNDLVCDGEVLDAESRRRVSALNYKWHSRAHSFDARSICGCAFDGIDGMVLGRRKVWKKFLQIGGGEVD